jgi:carbonic anhydrase/acetyltransferase-like protein (isoleucine patch superfamily)
MIRSFNGKSPRIAGSALVDQAACIIGDVEIGEESSVWPGAVIRGDMGRIKIGNQSIIEDNCVIHSGMPGSDRGDVSIGDRVIIGHGAVLNGRAIGNHVLIGMNATILHGVEIGSFCIIGAATLVGDGKKIPDYSLVVGIPGKNMGRPTEKQLWWVKEGYRDYETIVAHYRAQPGAHES